MCCAVAKKKLTQSHVLFDLTSGGRPLFETESYLAIKIYLKGKCKKKSFWFLFAFYPEINVLVEE